MSSLFGSDSDSDSEAHCTPRDPLVARAGLPAVAGLSVLKNAIPAELQADLALAAATLFTGHANQVMLFDSASHPTLPDFLDPLLAFLPSILPPPLRRSFADASTPRQIIVNLYRPGEGITPHIDLPDRYADLIVGVSLVSSAVMEFSREGEAHAVLLRPGDCYVLHGEARYGWEHSIPARLVDLVENDEGELVQLKRRTRISITFRRMKAGADIVGGEQRELDRPGP